MIERIAIVTGGGDCPGLNAVIRAVAKAASRRGWETLGFLGGFDGMLDPPRWRPLAYPELGSLLYRGGTVLGTSNRGRFSAKTGHGVAQRVPAEALDRACAIFHEMKLKALVVLGGDGSLSIAQQLFERGMPVVGVPKTIDNDVAGTIMTFGFDSATACAVDALDRLHSTAESHGRVMVLEVMGRYAGWIAGHAGLAGGADIILIPEIPFRYGPIVAKVRERVAAGKLFTVAIVAEGAREAHGDFVTAGAEGSDREARLGGIGHRVADEIQRRTGKETRAVVLGHLQRGGQPSPWDRHLCTRFGANAVNLVADGLFGHMTALTPEGITPVPLHVAAQGIRTVPVGRRPGPRGPGPGRELRRRGGGGRLAARPPGLEIGQQADGSADSPASWRPMYTYLVAMTEATAPVSTPAVRPPSRSGWLLRGMFALLFLALLVVAVAVALLVSTVLLQRTDTRPTTQYQSNNAPLQLQPAEEGPAAAADLPAVWDGHGPLNILLLGVDQVDCRYGDEQPEAATRTDTMILVRVDPQTKQVAMLSIPRDLLVYIPGHGAAKINTAHVWGESDGFEPGGGPGLLKEVIWETLGLQVHRFVRVDLVGFRHILEVVDGLDMDLPPARNDPTLALWDDNFPDGHCGVITIQFQPGPQHLAPEQVLQYARSRYSTSDFDRNRRQQEVLLALRARLLKLDMVPKAPQLLKEFLATVDSDFSVREILSLANLARGLDAASVVRLQLDEQSLVSDRTLDGQSVVRLVPAQVDEVVRRFQAIEPPPTPTPQPTQAPSAEAPAAPAGEGGGSPADGGAAPPAGGEAVP